METLPSTGDFDARPKDSRWAIVGASVPGTATRSGLKRLQDSHAVRHITPSTGVAIVADGAGSASDSDLGAAELTSFAAAHFCKTLAELGWTAAEGSTPPTEEWRLCATKGLAACRAHLAAVAADRQLQLNDLATTAIIACYSPDFLLLANIGDGRAAWRDLEGKWHAAMTPFKGPQVGETVFITSAIFAEAFEPPFLGVQVIPGPVTAFAVLTDGCENVCFVHCASKDEGVTFYDPNEPFERFFNKNYELLLKLGCDPQTDWRSVNAEWASFVRDGRDDLPALTNEPDDKTFILGVLLDPGAPPIAACD
jgi:hypothetical protein